MHLSSTVAMAMDAAMAMATGWATGSMEGWEEVWWGVGQVWGEEEEFLDEKSLSVQIKNRQKLELFYLIFGICFLEITPIFAIMKIGLKNKVF